MESKLPAYDGEMAGEWAELDAWASCASSGWCLRSVDAASGAGRKIQPARTSLLGLRSLQTYNGRCEAPGSEPSSVNSEAEVHVVPYDPSWPERFEEEREILSRTIGSFLTGPVEHVGSTAVPGLAAKPVIDIMAGVESLDASRPALRLLEPIAYVYFPYRADVMHWLLKPSPQSRTHHLHLVPFGSRTWVERLAFREILRTDASTAADYARLKRELAHRYRHDREAYTDEKAPFITRTLRRASASGHRVEAE